jgi:hypothetical protein
MISQRGLNDLIEDYLTALGKVNDAATILENASVMISGAGSGFTLKSVRVIDQTNGLYTAIAKVASELLEATPDA